METHLSIASFTTQNKTIVTIGTFDGVHIGHQKILKKITQIAKKENHESVVLTFFPHPRMVLQQDNSIKLLNTIYEKKELFENLGIDHLVIHPFDEEFSKLSAEERSNTKIITASERTHLVAHAWSSLSSEEKEIFHQISGKDKVRYARDLELYFTAINQAKVNARERFGEEENC